MRQVRSISRKDRFLRTGILRGHMPNTTPGVVKRWSDLHGDMQSQAEQEMTWPPPVNAPDGGNNSVGPYPMWA